MTEPIPTTSRLYAAAVMVRIAWAADRRRAILAFAMGAVEAVAQALFALCLKLLLDGIAAGHTTQALAAASGSVLSIGGAAALEYGRTRVVAMLAEHARHLIDRRLVELVGGTPRLDIHETPEHLNQLETLQGREAWAFGQVVPSMVSLVTLAVRVVATAFLLVSVHPLLLLLPLFGLPSLLLSPKIGAAVVRGDDLSAPAVRQLNHIYDLATGRPAAKEVRLFGLGDELLSRFDRTHAGIAAIRLRVHGHAAALGAASRLVFLIGYVGAIVFVTRRAVDGSATIGDAVLTAVLAGQVLGLVTSSADVLGWAARALAATRRYVYLERLARPAHPHTAWTTPPTRLVDGIRLSHVSYRYPHAESDALADIDLHLPAGATIAIVGDNGAGKTTLVKLLAGLYEPTSGRITVDGIDLADLDPTDWRLRTSAGFQDHARFEFSAGDSVGIGDLNALGDDTAVRRALRRAGAEDVTRSLPDGLSAMMRTTPLLLLLDEPTAALDAETEHRLFEQWTTAARDLRERTGGVTVLVSHRFSTVRMADLIVVVDRARVVETGTHDQLIHNHALYAELFGLQARAYR